jgi:hypothetical protein
VALRSSDASIDAHEQIGSICAMQAWTLIEMLRVHARKRTATARVRVEDGREAVLKCLLTGAPAASEQGILRERELYASELVSLAPKLIVSGETWFCRSYEAGMSLRRWMLQFPDEAEARLPAYLRSVVTSLTSSKQTGDAHAAPIAAVNVKERFKNLLTSGPAGTTRNQLVVRSARLVAGVSGNRLEPIIAGVVRVWVQRGACVASVLCHNDLHADNVLVGEDGLHIVDFENATRPGFWWIDALYLTATCYATLRAPTARERLVAALHETVAEAEPMMAPELGALSQLLCAAAVSNRRFRSDAAITLHDLRCLAATPRAVEQLARAYRNA